MPASFMLALSLPTVVTPSCRMLARRTASALPRVIASMRCWALPAPPLAMMGTLVASDSARLRALS